jgi:hypothetical protein
MCYCSLNHIQSGYYITQSVSQKQHEFDQVFSYGSILAVTLSIINNNTSDYYVINPILVVGISDVSIEFNKNRRVRIGNFIIEMIGQKSNSDLTTT